MSTNDCQPIQFDNASQVESLLESIRAASQAHIDAACKGKDAKYSSTVQDLLERVRSVAVGCTYGVCHVTLVDDVPAMMLLTGRAHQAAAHDTTKHHRRRTLLG